jgi:hypothetical protein
MHRWLRWLQDGGAGGRGVRPSGLHKTRLCEKFMTQGLCGYGDKCTFAHGCGRLQPS